MSSCFKFCSGGDTSVWDYSTRKEIEPHPEVFQVLECSEGSNFLYVVVKYPHCTNFQGEKVLVMKDTSKTDILLMKVLDPHFYEDNKIVARFKPDEEGEIVIHNEDYKTKNLKITFDNLLSYLANYSDKDYYSYYSQKLESI